MNFFNSYCLSLVIAAGLAMPALCQDNVNPTSGNVDERIEHQHKRIKHALEEGWIDQARAAKLGQALDDLSRQIAKEREQNSGALKPEQAVSAENVLNENNQLIKSIEGAGKSMLEPGNVVGPKWTTGTDGAQNAPTLLRQMKQQEKRQLTQERQALEQKLEQQQLQYEREMLPKLGDQRRDIIKQQGDVKDIRLESGAN